MQRFQVAKGSRAPARVEAGNRRTIHAHVVHARTQGSGILFSKNSEPTELDKIQKFGKFGQVSNQNFNEF